MFIYSWDCTCFALVCDSLRAFDSVFATVPGQSLVEAKIRQLQTENARLQTSLDEERQQNVAFEQHTSDLQLVSQQIYYNAMKTSY